MFEHNLYDRAKHTAAAKPTLAYEPVPNIAQMSLLVWGEHCIECAAPGCYSSCDLYESRSDGRCRRFVFGAYRNENFRSARNYGTEISFKKWGKIEARGNTLLGNAKAIAKWERTLTAASSVATAAGKVLRKITRDARWDYVAHAALERLTRKLNTRSSATNLPDAFLLEVYNPDDQTVNVQLTVSLAAEERVRRTGLCQISPSFRATVTLPPGYSKHEFDYRLFRSVISGTAPFDIAIIPEADTNLRLVFLTADFIRYAATAADKQQSKDIKCVVWDLDNTLWDGILVENPDVTLKPGVLEVLHYFDERGILLSIASKNDHEFAWRKLTELGVADLFLFPQISWMPKGQNVKRVAEQLDIGIDTLAFIDDNPFELDEVSQTNPDVMCINVTELSTLTSHARLQGSTTTDARSRRLFYKEAIVREQEESKFGQDYLGFLLSCGITLEIAPYTPDDLDRVAELVQRTNQLNFSGRKYSRPELYDILDDSALEKYVLKCSDKYGAYGTIGFSIVRHTTEAVRIEDFMVSCRVQGKFLEQAFFGHLLKNHNPYNTTVLWVNFRSTARNTPARKVLETVGFVSCSPQDGMILESDTALTCDFITVSCSAEDAVGKSVAATTPEAISTGQGVLP